MGDKSTQKKPGFFQKLFSSKSRTENNDTKEKAQKSTSSSEGSKGGTSTTSSVGGSTETVKQKSKSGGHRKPSSVPVVKVDGPPADDQRSPTKKSPTSSAAPGAGGGGGGGVATKPKKPTAQKKPPRTSDPAKPKRLSRKKTKKTGKGDVAPADPNQRLEFPTTPEMILAIHKRKPFLDKNEEWLVVELNEYECLVENLDIIKTIANHSKFFEVEPDELWEEFFEFVEEMPSYDEVINYDVWQEFRDQRYPC